MSKTIRLTAAQAMVRYVVAQLTADTYSSSEAIGQTENVPFIAGCWAIFGNGNVAGIGEALYASRDALPTYRGHNEQTMAHAAIAYSKQLRRKRAMMVTSSIGPGALNMVTAVGLAHVNRLPVLLVPRDVFVNRGPDPVLQQIEDFGDGTVSVNDAFKPVSQYFDRITRPEQLLTALPRAFRTMTDPADCGPVTLSFCQDVRAEAYDYPVSFFEPKVWYQRSIRPDMGEVSRMPSDTKGLRAYLDRYGVALCGGWCSGDLMRVSLADEKEAIRQQVEQFAALNAPCIVYAECSNTIQGNFDQPVSQRPKLTREEVMAYGKELSELARWSKDQGVALSYHHHMGAMVQDAEDIDRLMEGSTEDLTLLYDTGHLHFAGADPVAVLDKWGHRVHHVHFKDVRQPVLDWVHAEDKSFLDGVAAGVYSVPGDPDGCIDFQAVTDKLKAMDYDGWIVVESEQDPAKAPPFEYWKLGYDYITQICDRSGLHIER